MKLYEITIKPLGPFGTSMKGDTIFGQFCWEAVNDSAVLKGGLEECLKSYPTNPFAVFSSAFPTVEGNKGFYGLKMPDLPPSILRPWLKDGPEAIAKRKELRGKKWLKVSHDLKISLVEENFLSDQDFLKALGVNAGPNHTESPITRDLIISSTHPHNSINRITGSTGTAEFAPYSQTVFFYNELIVLTIFAAIDPSVIPKEQLVKAFERMGKFGFGRDASIGNGKFDVLDCREITPPSIKGANALYCTAPCVPKPESLDKAYFLPFVRFGKHGNVAAIGKNPFKNPVIMADEGAVFIPKHPQDLTRVYFGKAVTGISKSIDGAVCQGYSVCLPFKLEGFNA